MHHFLPLQRFGSHASGDHHAEKHRKGRSPQPHPAPASRGGSAQPGGDPAGLGHRAESPAARCGCSVRPLSPGSSSPHASGRARALLRRASRLTVYFALALIRVYQFCISPLLLPSCRYVPSCSTYAAEAIRKWGIGKGMWYAVRRLLRCHPFGGHGYDPVP